MTIRQVARPAPAPWSTVANRQKETASRRRVAVRAGAEHLLGQHPGEGGPGDRPADEQEGGDRSGLGELPGREHPQQDEGVGVVEEGDRAGGRHDHGLVTEARRTATGPVVAAGRVPEPAVSEGGHRGAPVMAWTS